MTGVLPAVRIALVATVIGAIGGAAVVVSLIERPGANEDNTSSIAAHGPCHSSPGDPLGKELRSLWARLAAAAS